MCGIVAAQQSTPTAIPSVETTIAVSGVCRPTAVRVFGYWKSRQNPRITIDWNGMPAAEASVEVYRGGGLYERPTTTKPILVLTTDANGHVTLPKLSDGKYYVLGRSAPDRQDDLYLQISRFGRKRDDLALHLEPVPGSAESVLNTLRNVHQDVQVSTFQGVVETFGKPAPNADIDVFARGLRINQEPIHLQANGSGGFSGHLPDGPYAVYVWKDSWESLFWLTISPNATNAGLRIGLCPIESE